MMIQTNQEEFTEYLGRLTHNGTFIEETLGSWIIDSDHVVPIRLEACTQRESSFKLLALTGSLDFY